ncbi:MAG: hypothetical protein HY001_01905 [Candidatus Portnoybacteria bacterium]|nr:hypothetical protein [Candidatus Portnoybacteria bacterium]
MNSEKQICQNCKQEFTIEPTDFKFYEKMQVPAPTFCPSCRFQRRLTFRNERTLYSRTCDLCKKNIISIYHKDSPFVVYCQECWWSDKWDPLSYGREYDFSKPFFQQFNELWLTAPMMGNWVVSEKTMVNSPYNNMVSYLKNCYFLTNSDYNEDCAYGCEVENSKDCVDNTLIDHCEFCYESVNCQKCYQTYFSVDCENCYNVRFSKNLAGCSDCFGCANLKHKKYYIFNKPYSKEDYEKKVKEFSVSSYAHMREQKKKAESFWLQFPQKYTHERHNTNISGDYIFNSKNTFNSWLVYGGEDIRYCQYLVAAHTKDSYDYSQFGDGAELFYEVLQGGAKSSRARFGWFIQNGSRDIDYGIQIFASSSIFGSIGLRSKKHCILNKQYTKEEFDELRTKIINHMSEMPYVDAKGRKYSYGEFFPSEMSPYGYNETTAQEIFPLSRQGAKEKGYDYTDINKYKGVPETTITSDNIPDDITSINEDILKQVIECEHKGAYNEQCSRAFRLIPQEYSFYKKMGIPLPHLCPNCRHYQRLPYRNSPNLYHRKCHCAGVQSENAVYKNTTEHFHKTNHCPNEFETTYPPRLAVFGEAGAPERKEIVYCESCYTQEVA